MLPVKKQEPEQIDSRPNLASGFGKVLGSIQGLQQRLGDFSYGEVSIAEAKVKMLIKQLTLLRENLEGLAQLKLEIGEINRCIDELPEQNFDDVTQDSFEKHPQLHGILQASNKLFSATKVIKTKQASAASAPIKSADDQPIDIPSNAARSAVQPNTVKIKSLNPGSETTSPATEQWPSVNSSHRNVDPPIKDDRKQIFKKAGMGLQDKLSFTIPSDAVTGSIAMVLNGRGKDWSFDAEDANLSQSETFTKPPAFEFPAETIGDPKFAENSKSVGVFKQVVAPKPLPISSGAAAQRTDSPEPIANTRSVEKSPEQKLDDSKALVPANHNFDQRLLEDVIKSYGDFASTPNLPAPVVESNTPVLPVIDPTLKTTRADTADPIENARKVLNEKKSGDLDRQLKKIIKDYGEYDIYERKRFVGFRAGGIIAFVVLGVVLALLYMLKPSGTVSVPQSVVPTQRLSRETPQPAPNDRSFAAEGDRVEADAVNSSAKKLNEN